MLDLSIQIDSDFVARRLAAKQRQIPFAIALTLTKLADKVQADEVTQLHKSFKVRGPWWKAGRRYGINRKKATKSNLRAEVYTRAHWLFDHVEGGTRSGVHRRAVPQGFPDQEVIRRKQSGAVSKPWLPSQIKNRFVIGLPDGKGLLFQWSRKLKSKTLVYLLIKKARIKADYPWKETAQNSVKQNFQPIASAAIRQALRTAR